MTKNQKILKELKAFREKIKKERGDYTPFLNIIIKKMERHHEHIDSKYIINLLYKAPCLTKQNKNKIINTLMNQ